MDPELSGSCCRVSQRERLIVSLRFDGTTGWTHLLEVEAAHGAHGLALEPRRQAAARVERVSAG